MEELLRQIKLRIEENNARLDATGDRYNIFHVLGIDHYETQHSKIIADILNPKGLHGAKDEYLKLFLQQFCPDFTFNTKYANVYTEYSTNKYRRIDILITNEEKKAIIIENKLYADDQDSQLFDYKEYIKFNFPQNKILYLTLDGKDAIESSSKGIEYTKISYQKGIVEWLDNCQKKCDNRPKVKETLNQYLDLIKNLTNQNMEKAFKNETIESIIKPENIASFFFIKNNYEEIIDNIINKIFIPNLREAAISIGLKLKTEKFDIKKDTKIIFENSQWEKIELGFDFWNQEFNKLTYGYVYKEKKDTDTLILSNLANLISGKVKYGWAYVDIENKSSYFIWKEEAFIDILNGKMTEFFIERLKELLEKAKDIKGL